MNILQVINGITSQSDIAIARTDLNQGFTARQINTPVTGNISGAVSVDLSLRNFFVYTLTGNVTSFTATNIVAGGCWIIYLIQDATGGRTLAFNGTVIKFPDGGTNTISTTANKRNILVCTAYNTSTIDCCLNTWT